MLKYLIKKYIKLNITRRRLIKNFKLKHKYEYKLIYFIYNISSLRFIYEKINPPNESSNNKPPSTFFIGVLTLYIALWGLSTQIYESNNSNIQTRYSTSISSLISNPNNKDYSLLITAQSMKCPIKPEIFKPLTPVKSILGYMSIDPDINTEVLKFIESRLEILNNANLANSNLENANLMGGNLKNANLENTNLKNAYLYGADLENAYLFNSNLENADLQFTYLKGANLGNTNLASVKNLTINQLSQAYNLYGSKLNPKLLKEIKNTCPELLEKPKVRQCKSSSNWKTP